MVIVMSELGNALFTRTQRSVLGLIYSRPDRSYYTNEILRLTGMGVATIKRELDRMVSAEILTLKRQGNQVHYQANSKCPIYQELFGIVQKTLGTVHVLRDALEPVKNKIDWAFVFGSIASGKESENSDVDLMLIGEVGFLEAVTTLFPAQQSLSREINPRVYGRDEWQRLLQEPNSFIGNIISKPRLDVIGQLNESG